MCESSRNAAQIGRAFVGTVLYKVGNLAVSDNHNPSYTFLARAQTETLPIIYTLQPNFEERHAASGGERRHFSLSP